MGRFDDVCVRLVISIMHVEDQVSERHVLRGRLVGQKEVSG